ncbi:ATP10 protein [Nitzschia inconspicua]|uniref:ATP10 protein n=1 Tax=Nitzschia inconspicua TaxID=303405 RepID=A0A9K3K9Z2_9STRA|nr:ATP10 protein [Nitzschia inconspicua]KAG7359387.1 ATP10 protein [Nitzschia inconspicua]
MSPYHSQRQLGRRFILVRQRGWQGATSVVSHARTILRLQHHPRNQHQSWRLFASSPPPSSSSTRDNNKDDEPTPTLPSSSTSTSSASSSSSSKPSSSWNRLEDANPERIHGIQVNPDSLGNDILPGNMIYKTYKWTGNVRKIPVELARGYFWMVSDLKRTDSKPTLSNQTLIPESDSQPFPKLTGLFTLEDPSTTVDIPYFFLDPTAYNTNNNNNTNNNVNTVGRITLLAVTFRDNGFKMIPTWTRPFRDAFNSMMMSSSDVKVQTYQLSITEHWVLYPLRGLLTRVMRNNTPSPEDRSNTILYFGSKYVDEFRDILRMHNIMTSYVFLLDDLGRVRFAGSGEASPEEIQHLIQLTKELIQEIAGCGNNSHDGNNKRKKTKK